jgi:hypothetical protein
MIFMDISICLSFQETAKDDQIELVCSGIQSWLIIQINYQIRTNKNKTKKEKSYDLNRNRNGTGENPTSFIKNSQQGSRSVSRIRASA